MDTIYFGGLTPCQGFEDHVSAHVLTYHHRLPSPAPGLESQLAPGYEADSERIEWGIVPVSPAGTSASLPRMDVMGTTYNTCLLSLRS